VTPPEVLRVLPVETADGPTPRRQDAPGNAGAATAKRAPAYLIRPDADTLVGALLPQYVRNQVYRALVETAASEHGARRTAMKNATDAAGDMLDLLTRTYNRARQGQITQELAEIVGGAEALKG
jgi:F-type H+-transporting ATPase subunit gamma